MTLNWKSVTAKDVEQAFAELAAHRTENRSTGLVIRIRERTLPAKEVLRLAYQIANNLPPDQEVKFSSGDGTLKTLNRLGFEALRCATRQKLASESDAQKD